MWGLVCALCAAGGHPVLGVLAVVLLVAVLPLRSRVRGRASVPAGRM
jgi:hypothetical protein